MSYKFILNTMLVMSLIGSVGIISDHSFKDTHNSSPKSVQPLKNEVIDTSSFDDANEIGRDELSISFTRSTTTPFSQSYQVTLSSQVEAYTNRRKHTYVSIDDPTFSPGTDYPSCENEADMPIFNGRAYKVRNANLSTPVDVIIPETLKYGTRYYIQTTMLGSNLIDTDPQYNGPINSIFIPKNITTIYQDSFTEDDADIVFNVEVSEEEATFDASVFPEGATINWGCERTDAIAADLNLGVNGGSQKFGQKDFIIGYNGTYDGSSEPLFLPLTIKYDVYDENSGEFIQTRYKELPLTASAGSYYNSVGANISSTSYSTSIDIDIAENEEVDDDNIQFYNIFYAVRGSDGRFYPDLETGMFTSTAQCSYSFKDSINNYITYEFDNVSTFQGYTSVTMNVTTVDGIYERLNPNSYNNNLANIQNGSMRLRYRFTNLNSVYYNIVYEVDGKEVAASLKITTPLSFTNLSTGHNKINFLIKDSDVGEGFKGTNIKSFAVTGLYVTLDLYIPSTNSIVTKSNVSSRFGTISVYDSSVDGGLNMTNFDFVLIWLMVIYTVVFIAITLSYFFYCRHKYKNDEFRRVKPKQFFKQAAISFFAVALIVLAFTFIYMRFWPLNNSVVVYNPSDIYVIIFSIAAVIAIGYYIRYFVITIRTNIERKRALKLKLDEDVVDDGTN